MNGVLQIAGDVLRVVREGRSGNRAQPGSEFAHQLRDVEVKLSPFKEESIRNLSERLLLPAFVGTALYFKRHSPTGE